MLEQARDLLSVMTMPVADGEEVAVAKVEHVRVCQVGVLVDFVGVVSRDASLCREGELSDDVMDRVGISGYTFLGRRIRLLSFFGLLLLWF